MCFLFPMDILTHLPGQTVLHNIQVRELPKPKVLEKVGHYFCCQKKEECLCVAEESNKEVEIFLV